jgi:uncharacterized protein (TIGR03067 family)
MTMRVLCFVALAIPLVSCQRPDPPSPANDRTGVPSPANVDLTLLVGEWGIEKAVADNKDWSKTYRLAKFEVAAGGKYMFAIPGLVEETGTITVDPQKNPKEMNLTTDGQGMNRLQPSIDTLQEALGHGRQSDDRRKNQVQSAIYQLDGDDLTICLSMLENSRPTEFETSANSWRVLLTCKRKKLSDKKNGELSVAPPSLTRPDPASERAVAFVEKLGGNVTHFEGYVIVVDLKKTPVQDPDLKELASLTKLLAVDLKGTRVTDAGLKELARLASLTDLVLSGTEVTDAGLEELAPLKNLTQLSLSETKMTDAGLKHIPNLAKLEALHLHGTRVTAVGLRELAPLQNLSRLGLMESDVLDDGFKELSKLKSLTMLWLDSTNVTGAGIKDLAKAKTLTHLRLGRTRMTDAGLKELAAITSLTDLALNHTQVTDMGIRELAALTNLTNLDLQSTQVTDAGLKELLTLKNLEVLALFNTRTSAAGLRELHKALPKCDILK